ncbi:MAG: hypothetical protein IPF57_22485 [Gammaproteobacteria bacterium]|nr:hypothetical protein [Gammaproteobacteria bacterium]
MLRALARRGIRIVLFSGHAHGEAEALAFRALAAAWHDVGEMDDESFAACVARERVGVLFDLCGHAPGNRLRAFAARLAPLQPSWGDWFCTTGLPNMDLFIGDAVTTPASEEHCFQRARAAPASHALRVRVGAGCAGCFSGAPGSRLLWQFQPPLEAGR